ncbi:MAG: F0F1 ATP synthase subunit A [Spirochaetales bacterium]|nr:F0F1 ATP synthase subunit A [Spirochaetales bacterium]
MKYFIIPLIFFFLTVLAFSQEAGPNLSETLFSHIQDSTQFEPFPFVPPVLLPFGMTVHMLMLLLAALLILAVFLPAFRKPILKPKRVIVFLESIVLFVRDDIVYPVMGKTRGEKWTPFFSTIFIFLLAINYLGLIPAFKSATGSITVTSALSIMIMVLIFGVGIKKIGFVHFFKNYYPEGTPLPIGLFVALLEFVGVFIKTIVLSLRLFANMFAGHLAILSFLLLMFVLNPLFGFVAVPFTVFTFALEVLVALIQALVFTLLSCIFITMASSAH